MSIGYDFIRMLVGTDAQSARFVSILLSAMLLGLNSSIIVLYLFFQKSLPKFNYFPISTLHHYSVKNTFEDFRNKMGDSDYFVTFNQLLSSVLTDSKSPLSSLERDFSGDLSFEELIKSAISILQKWSKLDKFIKSIEMRVKRKDDTAAEALRKEGNSCYKKWDMEMALIQFNESIKFSHYPPMEDFSDEKQSLSYKNLSFSYANRAAVLFEMGLYDEACTDIRRAVSHGYSQKKQYRSVGRYCKSLIYIHLKQNPQLSITSSVFDTYFEKTKTDLDFVLDDEQRKQIMEHKFDVEEAAIKKSKISEYIEIPKSVLEGEHPYIPGLSNKVDVTASNKRKYLIAVEDIYPGTLLAVDPGFVAATLDSKHVENHCSACSKPCKFNFVPCHQCTSAVFCNELCRDEAFKSYHRYECSLLPLFDTLEMRDLTSMTLRIIASLGYSKLHDYVKIFDREEEAKKPSMAKCGFSCEGVYDSKSYRTVYYLTDHKELREFKGLTYISCMAVVMTFMLKKYTIFFGDENLSSELSVNDEHFNEREKLIAKLIMRHLMSMEANTNSNISCEESLNVKIIGENIQCLLSLIGHSCNPNAICVGPHTLRSSAIIPKGTEICISYTLPFFNLSKQERQFLLIRQFHFICECIACVEDWQSNDGDYRIAISNIRIKCLFGCKNGTLNKLTQRCTKCSKGLKRKQPLYSETYLKHIKTIIYGSSSENSKSIQRDMALTTLSLFDELETQITIFVSNSNLTMTRVVTYNIFKGIYLFDKYGDCPSNFILGAMRESLQKLVFFF